MCASLVHILLPRPHGVKAPSMVSSTGRARRRSVRCQKPDALLGRGSFSVGLANRRLTPSNLFSRCSYGAARRPHKFPPLGQHGL
eukprot:scaffold233937_cov28-Tisochrysis_lutea.AAC.2